MTTTGLLRVRFNHSQTGETGPLECLFEQVQSCGALRDMVESVAVQANHGCANVQLDGVLDVEVSQFSRLALEKLVEFCTQAHNNHGANTYSLVDSDPANQQFAEALFAHDERRALFSETLCLAEFMDCGLLKHELGLYGANLCTLPLEDIRRLWAIENDLSDEQIAALCEQYDWLTTSDDCSEDS